MDVPENAGPMIKLVGPAMFSSAEVTDLAQIQNSAFISLHEAITDLAFGASITAKCQAEIDLTPNPKLNKLIDRCLAEVGKGGKRKYRNFPKSFPYAPYSAIIDLLKKCRRSWPPSAKKVMSLARDLDRQDRTNIEKYNHTAQTILDAARQGNIKLHGRPKRDVKHVDICRDDLLGTVVVPYGCDRLDEHQDGFEDHRSIVVRIHLFFDVCMDRNKFETLKKSLGGKPRRVGRPPIYDWATIRSKIHSILDDEGVPDPKLGDPKWKSNADLIHKVQDWCSEQWDRHPANSTLKPVVNEIIAEFEAKRAAGN